MKKFKVLLTCLLVAAISLTGCGSSGGDDKSTETSTNSTSAESTASSDNSNASQSSMEETTINIRLMNKVSNIDKVLDAYYAKVADDPILSKVKLNFSYVEGADYQDKLNLAITAEEDYDLMFVGAWQGLNDLALDGVFQDLSSYFNNDAYPGLKAAFSEDYVKANAISGKTYAIPVTESYEDIKGIVYREDLRKKYNLPEIVDYDTYEQYLQEISEHLDEEGLVAPWGVSSTQGMTEFQNPGYANLRSNIFMNQQGAKIYVALNDDGTKVLDTAVVGDDASHWANFPAGYNKDYISEWYMNLTNWTQYINSDAVSTTDDISASFDAGLYAATYGTATEWLSHTKNIVAAIPDAELDFFIMDEKQRNFEPGAIVSNEQAWNFLCVPNWSKKTDAVMAFLDWMWSSKENHDLFQYGIEGEDWEAIGDNAYRTLNAESYVMPGYSFCWNPSYIRYEESVVNNEKATKIYDYMYDKNTYTLSPLAGFTFDNSKVESEIAIIKSYTDDSKLEWGAYGDDTAAKIKEYHDSCETAGLDKIRTELTNQLQVFLDAK